MMVRSRTTPKRPAASAPQAWPAAAAPVLDADHRHVDAAGDELAMRHVDDPHHAEDDGQARDGRIRKAKTSANWKAMEKISASMVHGLGGPGDQGRRAPRRAANKATSSAGCRRVLLLRVVLGEVAADLAQPVGLDPVPGIARSSRCAPHRREICHIRWATCCDLGSMQIWPSGASMHALPVAICLRMSAELGRSAPSRPASCTCRSRRRRSGPCR